MQNNGYMRQYLKNFHAHKDVFRQFRAYRLTRRPTSSFGQELREDQKVRESLVRDGMSSAPLQRREDPVRQGNSRRGVVSSQQSSTFDLVKMHLLGHISPKNHIRLFGAWMGSPPTCQEHCHKELKTHFGLPIRSRLPHRSLKIIADDRPSCTGN